MKEKINKYNSSNQTTRKQPKGQRKVYEYEIVTTLWIIEIILAIIVVLS